MGRMALLFPTIVGAAYSLNFYSRASTLNSRLPRIFIRENKVEQKKLCALGEREFDLEFF